MEFLKPASAHQYVTLATAALAVGMVAYQTMSIGSSGVSLFVWFMIYMNVSCLVGSASCPTWGWLSILLPVVGTIFVVLIASWAGDPTTKENAKNEKPATA